MFADHLWDTARASGALSSRFFIPTFRDIGLVTAMELFVFLSGYVFGLVYSNILDAKGYRACQARALRRAREIYVWNLVALAAVVGIAGLMPLPPQLGEVTRLTALLADPARLWAFLAMLYGPLYTTILFKFVILIAAMPMLLLLYRRRPGLAFALSTALYVVAQLAPTFRIPHPSWEANILAQQYLFFLALVMGREDLLRNFRLPWRSPWVVGLLSVLAIVGILVVVSRFHRHFGIVPPHIPLAGRDNLQPIRLVYFFLFTAVLLSLFPTGDAARRKPWLRPLTVCGAHSLEVFCIGVALTYAGCVSMAQFPDGFSSYLAHTAAGLALMWAGAVLLDRRRRAGVATGPVAAIPWAERAWLGPRRPAGLWQWFLVRHRFLRAPFYDATGRFAWRARPRLAG